MKKLGVILSAFVLIFSAVFVMAGCDGSDTKLGMDNDFVKVHKVSYRNIIDNYTLEIESEFIIKLEDVKASTREEFNAAGTSNQFRNNNINTINLDKSNIPKFKLNSTIYISFDDGYSYSLTKATYKGVELRYVQVKIISDNMIVIKKYNGETFTVAGRAFLVEYFTA